MIKAHTGKVVIKLDEEVVFQENGLFIPPSARKKPQRGKVVGLSNSSPEHLEVGMVVFVPEICGVKIPYNEETFVVVQEHEIYAYL